MVVLRCIRRMKRDGLLRRKIYITLAVLFSYVMQGWSEQQVGMSLPALQRTIGVNQSKMSFTMIAWNAGCVVGSLGSGLMFDTYNRLLLMGVVTMGLAASTIVLPYCTSLIWMLVCRFVFGVFNGASDTGCNTIIPTLWGDACGPFVQIMYVAYALGGIISPFITIPFMTRDEVKIVTPSSSSNLNDTSMDAKESPSSIHVAFFITGVLFVVCTMPYFVMKYMSRFDVLAGRITITSEHEDSDDNPTCTRDKNSFKVVFLICMIGGVHAFYVGTEESLVAYLATFTLDFLQWSELESATLISVYWIASFVFGLLSIGLVTCIDSANIMWLSIIGTNCSFGLVIVGHHLDHSELIWIGFVTSGCSMVMVLPTVFTWSRKYTCEITGKVSSFFIVTAGLWSSANIYFVSHMMDSYSKMYFVITLLCGTVLCFLFYALAYFIRFGFNGPSTKYCCKVSECNSKTVVSSETSDQVLCVSIVKLVDY